MIEKLPIWNIPDTAPAFYDSESATALEATAKLHGKMNELIEDYNKFASECNRKIDEFQGETREEIEIFESVMRQEFQDFIDIVNLKFNTGNESIDNKVIGAIEEIESEKQQVLSELEQIAQIVQSTGDSETAVMSQKATTDELNKIHRSSYCEQIIHSADDYQIKDGKGLNATDGILSGSKYYTTDFIPVYKGEVIKFAMYSASTYTSLCFYNQNKEFVQSTGTARTTDIKYYNVTEDGFVRLSCHRDYIAVAFAYKMYSSIIERNADIEDVVYASADYHRETTSSKLFSMLIAGDIHGGIGGMRNIVQYLNYIDSFDAGIMLGDIGSSNFTHDTTFYTSALADAKKPFLTVIGNHDAGNSNDVATSFVNKEDLYNKLVVPNIPFAKLSESEITNEAYYYKDFTSYNIRVIVLNQHDHPATMDGDTLMYNRANSFYSHEQLAWFINVLNTTPNNYHVLIALHSAPDNMNKDFSNHFTSYARGTGHLFDHSCLNGHPIVEIVNAWKNGTILQKTYNLRKEHGGESTGETITVNADFTSRDNGVLIGYIGGHWHGSYISNSAMFPDQMMYSVDCANSGAGATEDSDTPRKSGTKSEDCFCAFSIDTTNRKINIVRIGAHMTNTMEDRFVTQISY